MSRKRGVEGVEEHKANFTGIVGKRIEKSESAPDSPSPQPSPLKEEGADAACTNPACPSLNALPAVPRAGQPEGR